MDKWIVPKDSLETALNLVENVPTRNGIKSSEYIKLSRTKKEGASFSLCSDLAAKVIVVTGEPYPFDSDIFLDRRLFSPFVSGGRESKASDYIFILKSDQLIVRHGHRKAVYSLAEPVPGYETLGSLDTKATSITKKWVGLVDCAENCATSDPIMPSLNCVYITQKGKRIQAMASNERIVFMGSIETERKPIDGAIAFPLGLVSVLKQEGATKLLWTNKVAIIEFPKGRVWQGVKTAARKSFPVDAIRSKIKSSLEAQVVLGMSSGAFTKAADRIAKYVAPLISDDLALEIRLTKGSKKIQLVAGNNDSKFNETLFGLTSAKEDLILEWPLQQVLPVILFAKDEGSVRIHLCKKSGESCISTKTLTLVIAGRSK